MDRAEIEELHSIYQYRLAHLRGKNKRQRELLRYLHVDWLKCVGKLRGWRKQLNGYVKAALED